jgi:hypothetical protein
LRTHIENKTEDTVAYSIKDDTLASRTARLSRDGGLPIRRKPYFRKIDRGVELGYRRNETNGTWVVRVRKAGITPWTKTFAAADDYEEANGKDVMTFYQAQVKARKIARGEDDGVEQHRFVRGRQMARELGGVLLREVTRNMRRHPRVRLSGPFAAHLTGGRPHHFGQ